MGGTTTYDDDDDDDERDDISGGAIGPNEALSTAPSDEGRRQYKQ